MDQILKKNCSVNCADPKRCDIKTGTCIDGCQAGWRFPTCYSRKAYTKFKENINWLVILTYHLCGVFKQKGFILLINVCTKLWLKSNAILIVTFLNRTYFIKLFWIVNQIKWIFDALLWSFPNNSKHNLIRLCMSILTYWKILWMISLYQILRTNTVAKN